MVDSVVIKEAMNNIVSESGTFKPKIGLKQFVEEYLPDLANPGLDDSLLLAKWLYISKGPYNEVNVINDDGSVAFTVPPLWVRIDVRKVNDARLSFNEVMSKVTQKTNVAPNLGKRYFQKCLPEMLPTSSSGNKYIKQWNAILESYGYSPIVTTESDSETKVSSNVINYEFKNI